MRSRTAAIVTATATVIVSGFTPLPLNRRMGVELSVYLPRLLFVASTCAIIFQTVTIIEILNRDRNKNGLSVRTLMIIVTAFSGIMSMWVFTTEWRPPIP